MMRINIAQAAIVLIAIFGHFLLTGCGSVRLVDSEVTAYSQFGTSSAPVPSSSPPASAIAAPAPSSLPATFRFERLPSQQSLGENQSRLEGVAASALAKWGFVHLPERAGRPAPIVQYMVQIGARTVRTYTGFGDAFGWMPGRDYVVTGGGRVIPVAMSPWRESPFYQREMSLLIRSAQDNRVVFETHARHDGRWADSDAILPAMFEAALQGFPMPPAGPRRVNIEIPR